MATKHVEQLRRLRIAERLLRKLPDSSDRSDALAGLAEEIDARKVAVKRAEVAASAGPGARGRPWAMWRHMAAFLYHHRFPPGSGTREERATRIFEELQTLVPEMAEFYRRTEAGEPPGGSDVPKGRKGYVQVRDFVKAFDDLRNE